MEGQIMPPTPPSTFTKDDQGNLVRETPLSWFVYLFLVLTVVSFGYAAWALSLTRFEGFALSHLSNFLGPLIFIVILFFPFSKAYRLEYNTSTAQLTYKSNGVVPLVCDKQAKTIPISSITEVHWKQHKQTLTLIFTTNHSGSSVNFVGAVLVDGCMAPINQAYEEKKFWIDLINENGGNAVDGGVKCGCY